MLLMFEEQSSRSHNMKMMHTYEDEVKWLQHYASFHEILLVGDGDFSFSLCLAKAFGSASNIIATSLDPYDAVISKYKNAKLNLQMLNMLGAIVLHGVDATRMMFHTDLRMRKFDRIIFNFPHAGFHGKEDHPPVIKKHRDLVFGFFRNACRILRAGGEVHVNHKTTPPFCHWNLEELAFKNSLLLINLVDFRIADYPGYNNKRGDGSRCDHPFPLGEASTYKFIFSTAITRMGEASPSTSIYQNIQHEPTSLNPQFASRPSDITSGNHILPIQASIRNDCYRTFDWYFDHAVNTFGRTDYDVADYVREGLRRGHDRYMFEHPGRPTSDYIIVLEELRHLSVLRSVYLRSLLLRQFDHH
ncbi:hypothetical protein Leryth_010155 [Lithospermum erythrorhizon]|uniref:Aminoacyl-tRNA synthetase n=1 Tax=Lithospermum erythrorhizon TaxID=34254 RepID=A0AAV3P9B2_LITER|nr:hypothetical protein Leryth_010155 [Lithospermum erythrorhizon]